MTAHDTAHDADAEAHRLVAFINTLHCTDGDDALADNRAPTWLKDWLGIDAGGPGGHIDQGTLKRLRTLREALRELAAANNGQQPDAPTITEAAIMLRSVPLIAELGDHQHDPHLIAPTGSDTEGQIVAAVIHAFFSMHATKHWSRLKTCAASDCRWAYLDNSRNRSRRWCDMAECGNRTKHRTWRNRHRATSGTPAHP